MTTHSPADCKSIFVSWTWAVGALLSVVVGIAGISYTYASRESNQEHRILAIEYKTEMIYSNIDTIKVILRNHK